MKIHMKMKMRKTEDEAHVECMICLEQVSH